MNNNNYWGRPKKQKGIKNLMFYLAIAMGLVYIIDALFAQQQVAAGAPTISSLLTFDRTQILAGQFWRVISFVILPPSTSIFFVIFALYFYWLIGKGLEEEWGPMKFNLYYLCGIVGSIISGFIAGSVDNYFLNMSMFFAAAMIFPNFQITLFFIIPIKMKWLAWIDAAIFVGMFIFSDNTGRLAIAFSLLNFFIFFYKKIFYALRVIPVRLHNKAMFKANKRKGEVISKQSKDYWKNK